MADTIVLARIWIAVVNVELAVLPLETRLALALVGADEILAGEYIHTSTDTNRTTGFRYSKFGWKWKQDEKD